MNLSPSSQEWGARDLSLFLGTMEQAIASAEADPLSAISWTPPQWRWLGLESKRKLFRSGNQVGKTWAGLAEVIFRCLGRHPRLPTKRPPIEAWIVCTSWQQSVAIMGKFHDLCSPSFLDAAASSRYSRRNGYGNENPTVVFADAWGGSIVRFKTTMQGAEAVASGTIDVVLADEPPTEEVLRELFQRVKRRGGVVLLTLTPINRPCGFIKAMVENSIVDEVNARLIPENLIPVGHRSALCTGEGVPMDAEWIAEQERITPPSIAGVVLHGDWETRFEGAWLKCFDKTRHVGSVRFDLAQGKVKSVLGIDYASATREMGQVAMLAQVQERRDSRGRPRHFVLIVDEVVESGVITNEELARKILEMLARNGLVWRDLASVYGDNPVRGRYGVERSNIETKKAIARELAVSPEGLFPRILSAKDGDGATMYDASCRWLYERVATGELMVHARCGGLIQAMETWDGSRDHVAKDRIDAVRYALKPFILRYPGHHGASSFRIG